MSGLRVFLWVVLVCAAGFAESATDPNDVRVMQELVKSLDPAGTLGWKSGDPCSDWDSVRCTENRVTVIKIGGRSLRGSLPADFRNLTGLTSLELQNNGITGPLPSFSGMNNLQVAILHNNSFSSIQPDFFSGLTQLQAVYLDHNPFSPWSIPASLGDATNLVNFSANAANITGMIPDFVGTAFSGLLSFSLAYNSLSGGIPASFAGSNLQILWLNNQQGSRLSGGIDVLANMTYLVQVWLQSNEFTGPIPDFSGLKSLRELNLRDNLLTGPAPQTLIDHPTLTSLMITDNKLQGRLPVFPARMTVDNIVELNSYCLPTPGNCDPRVDVLLSCVESLNYPEKLAESWKGNDPCDGWVGITCNPAKNVTLVNFEGQHFSGTISPNFGKVLFLEKLLLSNNNLTGHIPSELTTLANLKEIDVTNNSLSGKIPIFRQNVLVTAGGNPQLVKDDNTPSSPGTPSASGGLSGRGSSRDEQSLSGGAISGIVIAGLFIVGCSLCGFFLYKKRNEKRFGRVQSPNLVVHPRNSGSDRDFVKITVAGAGNVSTDLQSQTSSQFGDLQVVESGNMVISIQVLREVTNNFSKENVLGSGGFGTVYKGELPDGMQIAVKRMEGGIVSSKGLDEFKSEIAVLTNVRHRNLVSLHGYCFDGNERLLVYEYMPQGSLSKHLFDWKEDRRKPMQWKTRLSVALDVARGVEYLHSLARQSFIHRDLKPSNVLLGDDMRAKVSDFGLVRLAPSGPGHSIETKLAGTFGYLAPEYAVTGRVTIKVDVYSYGVVLMELITGRKAMDETKPEDSQHLVPWFRRMYLNKEIFKTAIDPSLELSEETLSSIYIVAELAGHCCAREPYQRPDMGHVVNVLSPLVELWKPSAADPEDCCGIDLDIPLPQALKKWQADTESNDTDSSTSNSSASMDNTQTSIATRPSGFAESFTSADGR